MRMEPLDQDPGKEAPERDPPPTAQGAPLAHNSIFLKKLSGMTPATPSAVGDTESRRVAGQESAPRLCSQVGQAASGEPREVWWGVLSAILSDPASPLKQGHLDSEGQPRAKHTHVPCFG